MNKLSNREIALSFFDLVVTGKVREWYNKHTDNDYIHHNQYFKSDRESLILSIEEDASNNPEKQVEVKMSLEDGDLVTTYSHVKQNPDDPGFALMHIFRFVDSRIVEMWDINQEILEDSPNKNGMF
ncbi:MAG: nuclear transport factor 2 family protein [Candidatus Thorarchaeota archaeon]|nr:MAG: nuclear transport factor 2 family protein [Candidatus Thorarchaeota archaeon]